MNGPWGTRQLGLVGDQADAIGTHAGRRLLATGVLEAQRGSTGPVDQIQRCKARVFRQLRTFAFEVVEAPCAFDPRRREPPAQGTGHPALIRRRNAGQLGRLDRG